LDAPKNFEHVRAVLSGRKAEFEHIVEEYQNLVASVAYRAGVRRDDIEDVVSEVFVKVYTSLATYRPEHSLSTWIYRIAMNHVIDHFKRTRRSLGTVELTESVGDPAPGASSTLAERERAERVRDALRELPEAYRLPLVLMHVEEKSIEEIAVILSLPKGTVKTRLARGRLRLAEVLRRRCPDLMGGPA
jgi:RNA polymerase sigma-70 factor, ECF subfamily